MAGMKRAAKIMILRNKGELEEAVIEQKFMMDSVGKLLPSIIHVGSSLLKWSYTETNYTLPSVFSAWADLDAGFTQVLETYMAECSRYRAVFKGIIAEKREVMEVQTRREKSAHKLAALIAKLESTRKQAKKNERFKAQVENLEAELVVEKSKDDETAEMLKKAVANFEQYKAIVVKASLVTHCQALKSLLEKGTDLCQTKLSIAESMPDDVALTPDCVEDNNQKAETVLNKHHLNLLPRDPAVERNLPIQRFKTIPHVIHEPTVPRKNISVAEVLRNTTSRPNVPMPVVRPVSKVYDSDEDDDHEYTIPEELRKIDFRDSPPPQLPPREDDYVIPTRSPKGADICSDSEYYEYFEVDSDDGSPTRVHRESNASDWQQTEDDGSTITSEPMYNIPPDAEGGDDDDVGDSSYHRGDEKKQGCVSPAGRCKPPVFPKPFPKTRKDLPSPTKPVLPQRNVQVEDFDLIYSSVSEDVVPPRPPPYKSGGSPPTPKARSVVLTVPVPTRTRPNSCGIESVDESVDESDDNDVAHTYYDGPTRPTLSISTAPPPKKPVLPSRKPLVLPRTGVK